ncbi:cell number regulator 2-like [Miscanthus floridulus]|uniref:cell number regulator 2-like n=1 Tax=Miscanthus floridulus TaxID=154761 RepID=UPI003457BE9B
MDSTNNPMGVQGNSRVGAWSSGLCACFADVGGCFLTLCCPCVTVGRIAEIVDMGETSCCLAAALYILIDAATGLGCLYTYTFRSKLRSQYGLPEEPCGDCCVHWCCRPLALCQEYRELKARGFDMANGWDGRKATVPPQVNQGMSR